MWEANVCSVILVPSTRHVLAAGKSCAEGCARAAFSAGEIQRPPNKH